MPPCCHYRQNHLSLCLPLPALTWCAAVPPVPHPLTPLPLTSRLRLVARGAACSAACSPPYGTPAARSQGLNGLEPRQGGAARLRPPDCCPPLSPTEPRFWRQVAGAAAEPVFARRPYSWWGEVVLCWQGEGEHAFWLFWFGGAWYGSCHNYGMAVGALAEQRCIKNMKDGSTLTRVSYDEAVNSAVTCLCY